MNSPQLNGSFIARNVDPGMTLSSMLLVCTDGKPSNLLRANVGWWQILLQKSVATFLVGDWLGYDPRREQAMMGRLSHGQKQFFYSFLLKETVQHDLLARKIAAVLDLSWVHSESCKQELNALRR